MRWKPRGLRQVDKIVSYRIELPNTNTNNWYERFVRVKDDLQIMEILLREYHLEAALNLSRSIVRDMTYIVDNGVKRDD